ncbi:hypothetical protein [Roseovarius sp. C03]|uniref:hypothetical protein n=1 Tax=Roseovarius sp. C03 TaxID=3449222 RepID=UPI003EDC3D70
MNLRHRIKALETQNSRQSAPEGDPKRRLAEFLDRIAERLGPPDDAERESASEFLKNEWPAILERIRRKAGGKHVD